MNALKLELDLELEDISLDLISSEEFDINLSIEDAKYTLKSLTYDQTLLNRLNLEFDTDIWTLPNDNNDGVISFNFTGLLSELKQSYPLEANELIIRVKCWVAIQLQRVSFARAQTLFNRLTLVINKTNYFHPYFSLNLHLHNKHI